MKVLMICNTDGALVNFRGPIIKSATAAGASVYTLSANDGRFDELRELGASPIQIPFSRHSSGLVDNIILFWRILKEVRRIKPDVVHSFTHKAAVFGTIAARLVRTKRTFVTITGLGTVFIRSDGKARLIRAVLLAQYRVALRFADAVFFQNPDDRAVFVEKNVVAMSRTLLTGGSGLDIGAFHRNLEGTARSSRASLGRELGIDVAGKRLVVLPSRSVREKGVAEYYQAAGILNSDSPGTYIFVHIGSTDELSSGSISRKELEAWGKKHGVLYLGHKSNPARYLQAADIVCLPSYREGVPRSLIEALALGKWIVTTDAPGCREVVISGVTGRLCIPKSPESLACALRSTSEADIEGAMRASVEYCREKFDIASIISLTLDGYGLMRDDRSHMVARSGAAL